MVELMISDGTEILDNLWTNLINNGARQRRHDKTHTGLLFSAIATEMSVVISLLQSYANQFTLNTATDRVLIENLSSQYVNRRVASKSKVLLTFYRLEGYTDTAKIPAGFAVRANGKANIIFKTVETVYLWKGTESVSVIAYSLNSGSKNNVPADTLTIFANNQYNGSIAVTNLEPSYGGYDDESIEHLRSRAQGFRYERDGTLQDIRRQLYENGVSGHRFLTQEFNNGPGTYLIAIDADSDSEFHDIVTKMQYRKYYGIEPTYTRVERIYVDVYVSVKTADDIDYTPTQKNTIFNNINTSIQRFFAAYCAVGENIQINVLKASIINNLTGFNVAEVDVEIANMDVTNEIKNIIAIQENQRAMPNQILSNIEFIGGE